MLTVAVQITLYCGCCVVPKRPKVRAMDILLELEPGRALPLATPGHPLLQVRAGRVWLTRRNDPVDHFLRSGDQLLLGEGDGVVVEAAGDEPVRLSLSRPPGWQGLIAGLWWRLATLALVAPAGHVHNNGRRSCWSSTNTRCRTSARRRASAPPCATTARRVRCAASSCACQSRAEPARGCPEGQARLAKARTRFHA